MSSHEPVREETEERASYWTPAIDVAIIPHPALGDTTIYLRLGWLLYCAGARVTFYSRTLLAAKECFQWLIIKPESSEPLENLAARHEMVIACFENYYYKEGWSPAYCKLSNVAFVTAKKIPADAAVAGRDVMVRGMTFPCASRAFCLDTGAGKTMVDWIDCYVREVFGLEPDTLPTLASSVTVNRDSQLIVIFPTTPQPKKNYWMMGFRFLAFQLKRAGRRVEFVCTPQEYANVAADLPGYSVKSFPNIKELMDYLGRAQAVISNDSGGGHLASMMGLPTYTITRRTGSFVWRPGFNAHNLVIHPWFRFKWMGKYIWRPFIPIWRISSHLSSKEP
ncbi:glycosyltransferase family 9 protein [Halopseudomonas bauzanensis]|uniref:Glycosyltransferase family 9 protein n=1 Tax=Halopseudomonas bauzanensis TaxID=653930 RepID=A0A4U0YTC3_9GAMM|nr:glycosyltransferase family 9 protein [Halopseudomonas bauzanensis]TKA92293.1 glycosyltransferase family 9 protein [Halopseudomonas bauzanensis]